MCSMESASLQASCGRPAGLMGAPCTAANATALCFSDSWLGLLGASPMLALPAPPWDQVALLLGLLAFLCTPAACVLAVEARPMATVSAALEPAW